MTSDSSPRNPVLQHIFEPLTNYYGPPIHVSPEQMAFFYDKWIEVLGVFPEPILERAFNHLLKTYKYVGFPSLHSVHAACEKVLNIAKQEAHRANARK